MAKVYNKKIDVDIPKDAVYIGRPSKWGNPFEIGKDGMDRDDVIHAFILYLQDNMQLVEEAKTELKGKDLVCFCHPRKCHGDIWLRIANA